MRTPSITIKAVCRNLLSVQAVALLSLLFGLDAHGQTFKYEYGVQAIFQSEAGFNRVAPVTGTCRSFPACTPCLNQTDGYIAVGRSTGTSSDVYVVRTDNNGAAIWEYTYDVDNGSYDVGHSIIELSNGTGFVVTGWTQTANGARAFLMKIDCDGLPVWTQVYRQPTTEGYYQAYGYDLVEARTGNGSTTRAGDIIVCGYTIPDRSPTADAMLFRTDATGILIWDATYNNGSANGFNTNEQLAKLIEASRVGGQNTGDIVSVGYTSTVGGTPTVDSYVLRVNGNDGTIGAAPQGAATYGGTETEQFYGLVELQNPNERGTTGPNIVLAGHHNEGVAAGGVELHLVKLNNGDPCDPALETIIGDRTTGYPDLPYDIREVTIPFGTAGGGTGGGNEVEQWDLVVTGETGSLTASNNRDAFLLSVDVAALSPIFGVAHRTSTQAGASEWGRSLSIVPAIGNRTLGVVMCGEVQGANFLSELFLVKTDVSLSTDGDCQVDFDPGYEEVDLYIDCVDPDIDDPIFEEEVTSEETARDWGNEVCTGTIKSVPGMASNSEGSLSGVNTYSLRIAPNLVASGKDVTLFFEGTRVPESVTVDVVNTAGETVSASSVVPIAPDGLLHINTVGWNAGSYFITVTDGSYRSILRAVIE